MLDAGGNPGLAGGFAVLFVIAAVAFNLLIAGIFVAERQGRQRLRDRLGLDWLLLAIPLGVVAIRAATAGADAGILIRFGLVGVYMAVEFVLDYVLHSEFRKKPALHALYIALEYAALFSLIAIAFSIGRLAGTLVAISFWVLMGALVYLYWPRRRAGSWQWSKEDSAPCN